MDKDADEMSCIDFSKIFEGFSDEIPIHKPISMQKQSENKNNKNKEDDDEVKEINEVKEVIIE